MSPWPSLRPAPRLKASKTQAGRVEVAIKVIQKRDIFDREKVNLTGIRKLNSPHLIKHSATCELKGHPHCYIVFPLANGGSILDCWTRADGTRRSRELALWSLQQMLGLAGAIRDLHYGFDGKTHCRHGDIKPANILVFEEGGKRRLVIADLGVSTIHDDPTAVRTSSTKTEATTHAYEAPEAHSHAVGRDKPRPRTYDIWSLGCVFLEFVIWLLYNVEAIDNFKENRYVYGINPDSSFYEMTSDGKAVVCPQVVNAIAELRGDPRCQGGTALGAFVDLLADKLLVTDVKERCDAETLKDELGEIVKAAEKSPSYLPNVAGSPLYIPKVFLPSERASKSIPATRLF